jgi:hypothetical protein
VHVKEENDGQDSGGDEGSSDELMMVRAIHIWSIRKNSKGALAR